MANYFKSFETTQNNLWKSGGFSVDTVVTTGSKNSEDKRLDCIYEKEYDSQKYSNISKLSRVTENPSFWLSFSVFETDDNNNFVNDSIWCSYRQVEIVQDFFNEILNTIQNDIDKIYIKNKVAKSYSDEIWQSETLTGGKSLAVYPCIVEFDGTSVNGVGLMIVDENNDTLGSEVTLSHFITLVNQLNKYDLYMAGHAVWIESLLIQLLSNSEGGSGRSASSKMGGRTIGSKMNGGKSRFNRNSFNSASDDDDDESPEDIEEEMDEAFNNASNDDDDDETPAPAPKKVKKSSKSDKKSSKSAKKNTPRQMSLDEMIEASDDVDIELGEDEDDEELF